MKTKFTLKEILSRWSPVLISMIIIFGFSGNHDPYRLLPAKWFGSTQSVGISKEIVGHFGHVIEFALLGFTTLRAVLWQQPLSAKLILVSASFCGLYAISDEIHQLFIPGRTFQIQDLLFDGAGASLGIFIQSFLHTRK